MRAISGFQSFEETALSFPEVIAMKCKTESFRQALTSQEQEIEDAIANANRTELDKWFRRQWYRAGTMAKWSPERTARYREWVSSRKRHADSDGVPSQRTDRHWPVSRLSSVIAYNGIVYGVGPKPSFGLRMPHRDADLTHSSTNSCELSLLWLAIMAETLGKAWHWSDCTRNNRQANNP